MKMITSLLIVLMCATLTMGCVSDSENTPTRTVTLSPTPTPVTTSTSISDRSVAKYDFEWYTTDKISFSDAPVGLTHAVITYRIKNDGYASISTNPHFWVFYANGVKFKYDSVSHSDAINTMNVDVNRGGDITNKIVFLIPDDISSGSLAYEPWYDDDEIIYKDNSLINDVEPTPYPTFTPRKPKEIFNLTLDDDGFLQWYDNQRIYYNALYVGYDHINYEESQTESNISLNQIDKFTLDNKNCILLKDEFKKFLETLYSMDERRFWSIYDDKYSSSPEQQLYKYWKSCTSIRKSI